MVFFRDRRAWAVWVACFAILMGALAPTVSHALMSLADARLLAQVCTPQGARAARADATEAMVGKATPGQTEQHSHHHCDGCVSATTALDGPPRPPHAALMLVACAEVPERFLSARHTPFVWVAAQPRAPPLFA